MGNIKKRDINDEIREHISVPEALAGLAEEASELAQAALKLRRSCTQINPTPTKPNEAYENLVEEVADVSLYISLLCLNKKKIDDIMDRKRKRWIGRLKAKKESDDAV